MNVVFPITRTCELPTLANLANMSLHYTVCRLRNVDIRRGGSNIGECDSNTQFIRRPPLSCHVVVGSAC